MAGMNQYPGEYIVDLIEVFVAASKNIARISPCFPATIGPGSAGSNLFTAV